MGMEFLAFHDQLVADLAADDKQDDFGLLNIIQRPQIADAELELRKRIGSKALNGSRGRGRLINQPGENCRLKIALIARGKRSQVRFGIGGYRDLEGHRCLIGLASS
jgi:hypothetical protein